MRLLALLLVMLGVGCAPSPRAGRWSAWLGSPGGDLPFGLELRRGVFGLEASVVNGLERISVPRVRSRRGELVLGFDHYDAEIRARVGESGERLVGIWTRRRGPGPEGLSTLPFSASWLDGGEEERGDTLVATREAPATELEDGDERRAFVGRWAARFESDEEPAVLVVEPLGADRVHGTVLTATGDHRWLAGTVRERGLSLSTFDGAHAFLLAAEVAEDGALRGEFWSGDRWHEEWTATRDASATAPDPFTLSRWLGGARLGDLAFPDLGGRLRRLDDPEFAGTARVLHLFGSWCPNCHDAAALLGELFDAYGDRGLSVVALAFELTGDLERDTEMVRRHAERHGVRYPILIAGTADKAEATRRLGLLDRVRAFPTTIFLRADGTPRAVHTGFAGPATGTEHEATRQRWEELVVELLGGAPASPRTGP